MLQKQMVIIVKHRVFVTVLHAFIMRNDDDDNIAGSFSDDNPVDSTNERFTYLTV